MKNRFARNTTAAAVTVALAALAASAPTLAVNLSDNGLGDVAFLPYYTVRAGFDTYLNVVNTSPTLVVAFKIRFHESVNSRDVRDFNVFLSPSDVWTARVTMGADGKTPQIRVPVADKTCMAPWEGTDPNSSFVVDGGEKYLNFTNIAYTGEGAVGTKDGGPQGIERAQTGYVEIIEMGVALPKSSKNTKASELAALAVHGTGQNCAKLEAVYLDQVVKITGSNPLGGLPNYCNNSTFNLGESASGVEVFNAEFCEPLNVLKVAALILDAPNGTAASMQITTLANFSNPAYVVPASPKFGTENPNAPSAIDNAYPPSDVYPNMSAAVPTQSLQVYNGLAIQALFANPEDAVSSLFSSTSIVNEYVGKIYGPNAWVVTFPTKQFYVDWDLNKSGKPAPFERMFDAPTSAAALNPNNKTRTGNSCVTVVYDYFNREEKEGAKSGAVLPSPLPKPGSVGICEESQTLNFSSPTILDPASPTPTYTVPLASGFDAGWMSLGFTKAGSIKGTDRTTGAAVTFKGLPVIGFSMQILDVGPVNVGLTEQHAYYRDITVAPAPAN